MEKLHSEAEPKTPETNQEWWREYLIPVPGESAESFLYNSRNSISSSMLIDNTFPKENKEIKTADWDKIEKETFAVVNKLLDSSLQRMPARELSRGLSILDTSIHTINNRIEGAKDKTEYFEQTIRDRKLKKTEDRYEALLYNMFGVANGYPYEEVEPIFKHRINGKTIVLLGGGDSLMDLLTESEFTPKAVVNVDPYLQEEAIQKNTRGIYQSIPMKAEDDALNEELAKREIAQIEEIWASYSVPCYLEKVEEIKKLFVNIDKILSVGGFFRIYPLAVANFYLDSREAFKNTDKYSEREDAWVESVKKLVQTGRYNLEVYDGVMSLRKLS